MFSLHLRRSDGFSPASISTWVVMCIISMSIGVGSLMAAEAPTVVSRDLTDLRHLSWQPGGYNSATVSSGTSHDRPAQAAGAPMSLVLTFGYDGGGFQYGGVEPSVRQVPGRTRRVSGWFKPMTEGYSWVLKFRDGHGREKVGETKLEMPIPGETGSWQYTSIDIPEDWVQPISVASITGHNWFRKTQAAEASLRVYGLQVETDVSAVADPSSLVQVQLSSGRARNIFLTGETTAYTVTVDSWRGTELTGTIQARLRDEAGQALSNRDYPLTLTDALKVSIPTDVERFGIYTLSLEIEIDGKSYSQETRFAYLPQPLELSREQKLQSPWGLNIHGGIPGVAYDEIARSGFTWVRDYAYTRSWILKARGADGSYSGWPWYPRMQKQLDDAGLLLLPCLMGSIGEPVSAGQLAPDREWKVKLLQILMDMPQQICWELDNEYDLKYRQAEQQRDWTAYDAYHRMFGETVNFMDETLWAVENGTAGMHPERVRQSIERGAFDQIDVVNGHYYCGTSAPELAVKNANTGGDLEPPAGIYDLQRELGAAADSDGKDRQTWITEFGWDTLAVHIVSEQEQAAYLQRGYLLGLQAGMDKMFWYWNLDTKDVPTTFFAGCGIFDPKDDPKPVVAAMAGMTHQLMLPEPVGTFDFGANSMGHVFRDRDRLVAVAFQLDKTKPAPAPRFSSGSLYDMYANPLDQAPATLALAPTWAVGVDPDDPIVRQTAYDLASRYVNRATAGDVATVQLRVRNTRQTPIQANFATQAPEGWDLSHATGTITVAPGETTIYPVRIAIPANVRAGEYQALVLVTEGDVTKRLPVTFMMAPAAELTTEALSPSPGADELRVHIRNNSLQTRDYQLRLDLPTGWTAPELLTIVKAVPAGGDVQVALPLTWQLDWQPDERAELVILSESGVEVDRAGIQPGALAAPRLKADAISLDGDLADWPASARVPAWALGRRGLDTDADLYLAHTEDGLYVALSVRGANLDAGSPTVFWMANTLELFIDSANNKSPRNRYAATDHQYWFCPIFAEDRIYAGRWKRFDEIPQIQHDLPGVTGGVVTSVDGYVMEFRVPYAMLTDFSVASGKAIGLNLNVTVPGRGGRSGQTSEVFWPRRKDSGAPQSPQSWGTLILR